MRVAFFGNNTGSKFWRFSDPAKYLRKQGIDARVIEDSGITTDVLDWADIVVLNSVVDKVGIALAYQYQEEKGLKIVVDCDDGMELNPDSPFINEHKVSAAPDVIRITMEIADLITTSTTVLADQLQAINPNVVVLPNFMDMERWDLPKLQNTSETIRIGWTGSVTHMDDLRGIVAPLKRICDDFPQVRLVFVGELRIADLFEGYPVECMLGVPFNVWPSRLQGLRLDIGLAPLKDTPFNRCKSNIKWQEYSIAQVPGVYSNIVYQHRSFEPSLGMVAYDQEQWYRCIKNLILFPDMRKDIAYNAYRMVKRKFDLEKNISRWVEAYQSLTS